jgi:hypothetical protein
MSGDQRWSGIASAQGLPDKALLMGIAVTKQHFDKLEQSLRKQCHPESPIYDHTPPPLSYAVLLVGAEPYL